MRATEVPAADPAVRQSGIGGSDAAAILGLSKWSTPLDVYLEKRGLVEPTEAGEAAEWGIILEPVIISEFCQREQVTVVGRDRWGLVCVFFQDGSAEPLHSGGYKNEDQLRELMGTLRHPEYPFMMCHVDGVLVDEDMKPTGILEAKTSSAFRGREWGEDEDEIPEEYVIQCTHNAEIIRAHLGTFLPVYMPVLLGGQRWKLYQPVTEHREDLVDSIIQLESEFWSDVQLGNPPPPEPDERGKKALDRLYPTDTGEELVVEPHSELEQFAMDLHKARTVAKEADHLKVASENRLKDKMGDYSRLVGDKWSVTWKQTKDREKTDWEAVANDLREFIPPATFKSVVTRNTTKKPGYRMFRPNFKALEEND